MARLKLVERLKLLEQCTQEDRDAFIAKWKERCEKAKKDGESKKDEKNEGKCECYTLDAKLTPVAQAAKVMQ